MANFPAGAKDVDGALRDAEAILHAAGDEVDLVLPWRATDGRQTAVPAAALVAAVRRATEGHALKLIIESGELKDEGLDRAPPARSGLDEGVGLPEDEHRQDPARRLAGRRARDAAGHCGAAARGGLQGQRRRAHGARCGRLHRRWCVSGWGPEALAPQRLRFGASGLLGDIAATLEGRPSPAPPAASTSY